jgi:hypothetical protein
MNDNVTQFAGAVPSTQEGDPGKYAYLRNPNWQGKPHVQASNVDPRLCPGCLFPHAMRKHEHVDDERCQHFRNRKAAEDIEAGRTRDAAQEEIDAMAERLRRSAQ